MTKRALVLVCGLLVVVGCTRTIDAPKPQSQVPVAPIAAGSVGDLLSEDAVKGDDGNLFTTVDPEECAGIAREVEAPFVFDHKPAAHTGGHWVTTGGTEVYIEEIVAVYRANFDARSALAEANRTIASCRGTPFTVTAMRGRTHVFSLLPQQDSGDPNIVVWSFAAPTGWACDNTFVAAHNAAVEITACAETNGYDVLTLAKAALERIEKLANTTL